VKLVNGAVAFPPPTFTTFAPDTAALTFVIVLVDTSTIAVTIADINTKLMFFRVFIGNTNN
jgi:hypothetical protein